MGYAAAVPGEVQQQQVLFALMNMNGDLPIGYFKYTTSTPRKKGIMTGFSYFVKICLPPLFYFNASLPAAVS